MNEFYFYYFLGLSFIFTLGAVNLLNYLKFKKFFFKIQRMDMYLLVLATKRGEKIERQRISADLHDGIQGDLHAVRNYVSVLQESENDPDRKKLFQKISVGMDNALENIRHISRKLMPPILEKCGLVIQLEEYFSLLTQTSDVYFSLVCKENIILKDHVAYELYRIIQEFANNALKHGNVKKFNISIYSVEASLYIEIEDDGRSYNFQRLLKSSTGGIYNIVNRMIELNCRLSQLDTKKGNHFVISLSNQLC